ncbi:hypothetical protein AgCh_016496 [Apium graveolens]
MPAHWEEKVDAIELDQAKQQAQLDEVLENQDAQQTQLNEIQSLVILLLSLLLTDVSKKGEKVVKSKCSPSQTLKKKDDHGDDQGNSEKSRGQSQGKQLSRIPTQQTSSYRSGKKSTFFYKDPKIQSVDEELAKRLFLKDNPEVDLEELREEEAKFAAEKSKSKSKASDAKKPPRPKEKGIVIRERSATEIPRSRTRSQTITDPKDKGKGKVGETVKKQKMKIPQILVDLVCKMVQVFDDDAAEDETVETLKRKMMTEESKTTSDIAQVVQSEEVQNLINHEDISEQQATDETANPDQFIKTSTSDTAQVVIDNITLEDKKKLLWNKSISVQPKTNQMLNQLAAFGVKAKQARDISELSSDREKF